MENQTLEIVGIQFKGSGKIYYFSPLEYHFKVGDLCVVETVRGLEIGEVVGELVSCPAELEKDIKPILRIATKKDLDNRLKIVEDKVLDKEYGLDKIFFNGQFYDAYMLIQKIFESASKEIVIIDNYVDRSILDRLVVKKPNVLVNIYTNINAKLLGSDIKTFNNQYGGLSVLYTTKVHDRYIIIDNKDLYLVGGSIKDLGKKIFSIVEMDNSNISKLLKCL